MKSVEIYADGACKGDGKGGYGVVLIFGEHRKELSAGLTGTTNNRMEMLGVIAGLKALNQPCKVTVYSDSRYVVHAVQKGWLWRWQKEGWVRRHPANSPVKNKDLWQQLLAQCDRHQVEMVWVKGHSGVAENERCDELASQAALSAKEQDHGYETSSPTTDLRSA